MNLNSNGELYHHGILGMKWGVRRYQNLDGTRTDAGKRRLRTVKNMSDDELKKRTNRMALERNYKNEVKQRNRIATEPVRAIGKGVAKYSGMTIAAVLAPAAVKIGKAVYNSYLDKPVDELIKVITRG